MCGMFCNWCFQSSNLLPSSLLTDVKVVPPSPPIQSVHPLAEVQFTHLTSQKLPESNLK